MILNNDISVVLLRKLKPEDRRVDMQEPAADEFTSKQEEQREDGRRTGRTTEHFTGHKVKVLCR